MRLFIVAGETSGDLYGSLVVDQLRSLNPKIDIRGWGGDKMAASGVNITSHIRDLNFMGFTEVFRNLTKLIGLFAKCKKEISDFSPDAILFIDFPSFNLRIAHWAKRVGITTHWYIAPKVWASRDSRLSKIKKYIDHLYCILPFEEKYFEKKGIVAKYVGHPLLEIMPAGISNQRSNKYQVVALLPGSRIQEVRKILPVFSQLIDQNPSIAWKLARVSSIELKEYERLLGDKSFRSIEIILDDAHSTLAQANFAIVTSGTATLEAALIGTPQVVVYKTSQLNYLIAKRMIRTRFISLPNLLLDKPVINELIQSKANSKNIKNSLRLFENKGVTQILKQDYIKIRNILGKDIASLNVARAILKAHM